MRRHRRQTDKFIKILGLSWDLGILSKTSRSRNSPGTLRPLIKKNIIRTLGLWDRQTDMPCQMLISEGFLIGIFSCRLFYNLHLKLPFIWSRWIFLTFFQILTYPCMLKIWFSNGFDHCSDFFVPFNYSLSFQKQVIYFL